MPDMPGKVPTPPHNSPKRTTSQRGYGTAHQKLRKLVIAEQHGICFYCEKAWATDLHHINRITSDRSRSNVVALCERCHHSIAHQ